jgi:hypothetical protein
MTWPATSEELIFASYRAKRDAHDRPVWDICKGENCGARILWVINPNGKRMPFSKLGNDAYQPHFIDCKDRASFSTRKKPAAALSALAG